MSDMENYAGFYSADMLPALKAKMEEYTEWEVNKISTESEKLLQLIVAYQQAYIGDTQAPSRRCGLEVEFLRIFMDALGPIYDKLTENLPAFKRGGVECHLNINRK